MGITDKAVSKWETGRSMPDLSLFHPLCGLLHITLNELLLGELIAEENIKEKSEQVLFEVITSWLGKDPGELHTTCANQTIVLKLKNVKKVYETENTSTVAVNHISFEVQKGSFVGIMGASGSGKSTLLNMIATIDKATSGTIEIDGQNIEELSEIHLAAFRRKHLGFIFQDYNLLDTLTVYENIALVLIMAVLSNYVNTFMVKQRAKEFATYLLLGMEKGKLSLLFLIEFSLIGIMCFLLGVLTGSGLYIVVCALQNMESHLSLMIITESILQTFLYFCLVEILSILCMKQKIYKLEINQLINEKRRNQPLRESKKGFWMIMFFLAFFCFLVLLFGIVFLPDSIMAILISCISIPILLCIFAFYKWLYAFFSSKRLLGPDSLYQGNRLYQIAEITAGTKTSAVINTVFCICLLFSAVSFVFGILLLSWDTTIFTAKSQQWMGLIQISICIIFMVIYFSILSFMQIVALKQQARHIQILYYMGKNPTELKGLIRTQTLLKLFLPMFMCFILLGIAAPLLNHKLNAVLPIAMHNSLLHAAGGYDMVRRLVSVLFFCSLFYELAIYRNGNKILILSKNSSRFYAL